MARSEKIIQTLRQEMVEGLHGRVGDRFMAVRELAERFGISLTTAHKVLGQLKSEGLLIADSTNRARISPKVEKLITLHQQNNPRRLGLVVTNIASPFFSSLCRYIQQSAASMNYQALVASSDYDFERERKAIESFLEIGVEGLLICPGLTEDSVALYQNLLEKGIRLVFVARRVEDLDADFVVAHNFVGAASVAGHFLSLDYNSFGYISFAPLSKHDVRLNGFRTALAEEGFHLDDSCIVSGDGWDVINGYKAMEQLMSLKSRPRAVFAFHDLLAIGALQYCEEHGIAVPEEVAVAGFDNLPESRVSFPPLTTVDYGVETMARVAVQNIIDSIVQPREHRPAHVFLAPHLVVRRSTSSEAHHPRKSTTPHAKYYELL